MKKNNAPSSRPLAVSGLFYPETCEGLKHIFRTWQARPTPTLLSKPKALIVPHAGYRYSGFCAWSAYKSIGTFHRHYKRAFIVGPSHHVSFQAISGGYYEHLLTPCGPIEVDTPYLIALAKTHPIGFVPKAHRLEHSTEVQFPLLKYHLPHTKAVELIYADVSTRALTKLFTHILQSPNTLLIVSTDLSHYHPRVTAHTKDIFCLNAFKDLEPNLLRQGCEACGIKGLRALILASKALKLTAQVLCYNDSSDADGRIERVVGYMSGVVI